MPISLNGGSEFCNSTLYGPYAFNLTSSYANQRNETTMVATSIAMLLLAVLFFNLNLFSAFSDVSAFLIPSIRPLLSASLSIFLPVMSYLFSQGNTAGQTAELSVRARTILTWMLLVEILRNKVEAILSSTGGSMQVYSGTIERASRITWLGYLVFYNLKSAGKRAFYGILWVLAAAKLVQRFVTSELAKRSFAYGKNPQLVASYMAKVLSSPHQLAEEEQQEADDDNVTKLLKRCRYVVMGEEELEKKAATDGYHVKNEESNNKLVTVGRIWRLAESDELLLQSDLRLKRLCLSFALYKLLRRRLEGFPITDAEARDCHGLIFKGLCREMEDDSKDADALFQVFNDEAHFLCEYYHSVLPVMFATPFFFLVNYIVFPIVVGALCVLTIILSSHGDVGYAFNTFWTDNYGLRVGLTRFITCMIRSINDSPMETFASVDVSVTILLFLTFAYEQVWEFVVFLFSNWFIVSLICSYAETENHQQRLRLSRVIRGIMWGRKMVLRRPNVCVKQLSLLWFCRLPYVVPTREVPREAKVAIMRRLRAAPPSNGRAALEEHRHQWNHDDGLSWACDRGGVADVMLTWHIATAMLEAEHPLQKPGPGRKVATTLSAYCAYLVAFCPELLPDDKDGTERVYKDMNKELKKEMGCWRYYCSPPGDRRSTLMAITGRPPQQGEEEEEAATVLTNGAWLGKALIDKYQAAASSVATDDNENRVWKLLADVWTELLVYAAPTASDLHAKAHTEALTQGGEFITILWAIATHTGITRQPVASVTSSSPSPV